MPTVLRTGAYRFFFYSNESDEPRHIHIQREERLAKFWLQPVVLASSSGFARSEVGRLTRLVEEHQLELVEAWDEFFSI